MKPTPDERPLEEERGVYKRKGRPGWYYRRRRSGRDEWTLLGTDEAEARVEWHRCVADPEYRPASARKGREVPLPTALTVEALAERWIETHVKVNRNPKGQRLADMRVKEYVAPFFKGVQADRVTKDMMREHRLYLEGLKREDGEHRLMDNTVVHLLSDARCMFNWAADSDFIAKAPIPKGFVPDIAETETRPLSQDEQRAVCEVEDPWGWACRLGIACGGRWSELCRLDASHVNGGEVVIEWSGRNRRERGGGRIKARKTRRVPVGAAFLREVRGHVGRLIPFEAKDCPTFMRSVQRRSGVEDFSTHRLRHSFAVNYLRAGGNLRALQFMLGHASITTTERYLKIVQELVRDDARKVIGWDPSA